MLAWNEERTTRLFVNATSTQSPGRHVEHERIRLEGDRGCRRACDERARRPLYAAREAHVDRATTVNCFTGAVAGHGLPGSAAAGGRPPVCTGRDASRRRSCRAAAGGPATAPGRTRRMPHAPSRNFRLIEFS